MGLSKHANYSVVVSAVVHIVNLIVVYCTGHLNMVTMGLLVSVAEGVTLLYRVAVIVTHRHLLKEPPKHDG